MKFNELKKELKQRGISFTNTMKKVELQELYDESEKVIQLKAEVAGGLHTPSTAEVLEGTTRQDGSAVTKNGILIPAKVLARMSKTNFVYNADCTSDTCRVYKTDARDRETHVRDYTKEIHGENFRELTEMFVNKNNK